MEGETRLEIARVEGETRLELSPTGFGRLLLSCFAVPAIGIAAVVGGPVGIGVAAALSVGYGALFWRLGRMRLLLDGEGIERHGVFSRKRLAWGDIQGYSFSSIDPSAGAGGVGAIQGGVVGVLVVAALRSAFKKPAHTALHSGRLLLRGAGTKLKVDPGFRDVVLALEQTFAEVHRRLADTTRFGPLTFDGSTLTHVKKGALALMEIEKVSVGSSGTVTIRKVGKRLSWVSLPMARIDNLMLLLEKLADRGVSVEVAGACYLPGATLHLIDRLAAAQRSLPSARVHQP